jgi:geranylgeranylglycerol-phosphate geranylgeranyltransferase
MKAKWQDSAFQGWISKAVGVGWLIRLPILSVLGLAIALNMRLSHLFSWHDFLLSMPLAFFLYSGGFALNDYVDLSADSVNLPHRPLPAGKLSPKAAIILAVTMSSLAIIWAAMSGTAAIWYAILFTIMSAVYSLWTKRHLFLLKNFLAAVLNSSVFLFMALHLTNPQASWYLFGAALLLGMAREIIMDVRDIDGDINAGLSTIATVFGNRAALWFASVFLIAGLIWIFSPLTHFAFQEVALPWTKMALVTSTLVGSWVVARVCLHQSRRVSWFIAESLKVYWLIIVALGFESTG